MTIFLGTPWWLQMIVVIGTFVVASCAGHALVKRAFPKADFVVHNEVAGFIIAVVGVLYSVLLGFLTVIVWEQFAQAQERAGGETSAVGDAYALARTMPQPAGRLVREDIARYVASVLTDEWPNMRRGERSAGTEPLVTKLLDDSARFAPRDLRESNVQHQLLDRVQTLVDLRQQRLEANRSAIPHVVWAGLIVGALAVMGFIYLFGYPNVTVQMLMTACTATVIGVCFSIVIKLDFPFRGDVSISSQGWNDVQAHIASDVTK